MEKQIGSDTTEYIYSIDGQVLAERKASGDWNDYVYAGSRRLAKADSFSTQIHFSGTNCSGCGYEAWAYTLPFSGYTIQPGDKIAWRQYQSGPAVPRGGLAVDFGGGVITNWTTTDQNGQIMNDLTTQNQWVYRIADLSAYAGKVVIDSWINEDSNSGAGDWDERFADIAFYRADGTVVSIYDGQTNVSYSGWGASGVTNQQFSVEQVSDPTNTSSTTWYYHGDQLGSTRLLSAGGGWPLWSATYAPYGWSWTRRSPSTTTNSPAKNATQNLDSIISAHGTTHRRTAGS